MEHVLFTLRFHSSVDITCDFISSQLGSAAVEILSVRFGFDWLAYKTTSPLCSHGSSSEQAESESGLRRGGEMSLTLIILIVVGFEIKYNC
jgi:hypothetical protein